MVEYKNLRMNSNVESYEIFQESIVVKFFGTNEMYLYTNRSAGVHNVYQMKKLAIRGWGLNGYINRFCRKLYERKVYNYEFRK